MITKITYGYQVEPRNDPFIEKLDRTLRKFTKIVVPGRFLVDWVPACAPSSRASISATDTSKSLVERLPDWFPGAGFKTFAQDLGNDVEDMTQELYSFAKLATVSDIR